MFSDNMTIFNKYGAESYQRTQVPRVAWENRHAVNTIAAGGNINVDRVAIYIPFKSAANYLPPKEWETNRPGHFTLKPGDVVVYGLVSDTIGPSFTIGQLRAKYDDVFQITSVDRMDMGRAGKHWMVGAK